MSSHLHLDETSTTYCSGVLDVVDSEKGKLYFLRTGRYLPTSEDIYISQAQVRRFRLRTGDLVSGQVRTPEKNEHYRGLVRIEDVNGLNPDRVTERPHFYSLTADTAANPLKIQFESDKLSSPGIDQQESVVLGQFGLIACPLGATATGLVKVIASILLDRHPEIHVFILLVGGTPAAIADMERSVKATTVSSRSNDGPADRIRIAELLMEHARRRVESGQRVAILIDSISRLAQDYQAATSTGLGPALDQFCIVGNFNNGGSLTIVGTLEASTARLDQDPLYRTLRSHRDLAEIQVGDFTLSPPPEDQWREAERHFEDIRQIIEKSSIEQELMQVALYDLAQARIAYQSTAYKSCIVMLGAVLEGIMLGTLRRSDVLERIRSNSDPPAVIKALGLQHPKLRDKIAEELGFEDYRHVILHLIPEIESLQVLGIQTFRNTIHPWKVSQAPSIYGDPDDARALHHITALVILVRHILGWQP